MIEILRDFYIYSYENRPALIPAILGTAIFSFLLLVRRAHKSFPAHILPFLGADAAVLFSLSPLGISFGPPLVPLFCLCLLRMIVSSAILGLAGRFKGMARSLSWSAVIINIFIFGLMCYAVLIEPFALQSPHILIESEKLAGTGKTIRIAHVSDIHIERETRRERKVITILQQEKPDLILLTGDYLNLSYYDDEKTIRDFRKMATKLSAPLGVYAIGGTIENILEDCQMLFEGSQVRLLDNEIVEIPVGKGSIELIGVTDTHDINMARTALSRLMKSSDPARFRILIYHTPDLFPEATQEGIDLVLSGHTHGGQICFPFIGALYTASMYGRRYASGLYRTGNSAMIVSRGIGMEGVDAPRARFLSPPEIPILEIDFK